MSTSGNRAIDMLITYRLLKLLVVPFEKQDAFKYGIIDKDGKVLRRYSTISKTEEKKSYTWLHRFVFNVKRIMKRAGLGGRLGSLAVALGLLLKEETNTKTQPIKGDFTKFDKIIESAVAQYCKHLDIWDTLIEEDRNLPQMAEVLQEKYEDNLDQQLIGNYFGCDVFYNENKDSISSPRSDSAIKSALNRGIFV